MPRALPTTRAATGSDKKPWDVTLHVPRFFVSGFSRLRFDALEREEDDDAEEHVDNRACDSGARAAEEAEAEPDGIQHRMMMASTAAKPALEDPQKAETFNVRVASFIK